MQCGGADNSRRNSGRVEELRGTPVARIQRGSPDITRGSMEMLSSTRHLPGRRTAFPAVCPVRTDFSTLFASPYTRRFPPENARLDTKKSEHATPLLRFL